jgi:hypothetical protein
LITDSAKAPIGRRLSRLRSAGTYCAAILLGHQQEWRKKYTWSGCFHTFSLLLFHYEAPLGAVAVPMLLDHFQDQHSGL